MGGFRNERILGLMYFSVGGTGSGKSSSDPADATLDQDIMPIEAGSVITGVDVVVTTAVTGSSPQINVGDDDDPNGYVDDGDVTEGTPGVYHGDAAYSTSAGAKHYASAGKEVKYDAGGTISAGAFCVVVLGYRI